MDAGADAKFSDIDQPEENTLISIKSDEEQLSSSSFTKAKSLNSVTESPRSSLRKTSSLSRRMFVALPSEDIEHSLIPRRVSEHNATQSELAAMAFEGMREEEEKSEIEDIFETLDDHKRDIERFKLPESVTDIEENFNSQIVSMSKSFQPQRFRVDFEQVISQNKIMIGSVSKNAAENKIQAILKQRAQAREKIENEARNASLLLQKREIAARERLITSYEKQTTSIKSMRTRVGQHASLVRSSLHRDFQRLENSLLAKLASRGLVEKSMGKLDENYKYKPTKITLKEFFDTPAPVYLSIRKLVGVRNRLVKSRYVMRVELLDELSGVPLRYSGMKQSPVYFPPFSHSGYHIHQQLNIDATSIVLCPPSRIAKVSNVYIFQIYQIVENSPKDRIVGWGAFPIFNHLKEANQGSFKVPILKGRFHPEKFGQFLDIEDAYCADLDSWLCNMYFDLHVHDDKKALTFESDVNSTLPNVDSKTFSLDNGSTVVVESDTSPSPFKLPEFEFGNYSYALTDTILRIPRPTYLQCIDVHRVLVDPIRSPRKPGFLISCMELLLAFWFRSLVHHVGRYLYLQRRFGYFRDFDLRVLKVDIRYSFASDSVATIVGAMFVGPASCMIIGLLLLGLFAFSRRGKCIKVPFFLQWYTLFTCLDPLLVLVVDAVEYGIAPSSSFYPEVAGIYEHYLRTQGSGFFAIWLIGCILFVVTWCISAVMVTSFVLLSKRSYRMDLHRRLTSVDHEFMLPLDEQVSMNELTAICFNARSWKGLKGGKRVIETTANSATIYQVKSDGTRELWRSFKKLEDGHIVENIAKN